MSLEHLSSLAQVIGSIGVILSLVFVGLQIKHNTAALQRNEHNSTMEQWTVIRMAIAKNRDIAELMTAGLRGESALDAADQLRLEQLLGEHLWAAFHIWDRTQRGVFPKGTFELTTGPGLRDLLKTAARRRLVGQRQEQGLHSCIRRRRRRNPGQRHGARLRLGLVRSSKNLRNWFSIGLTVHRLGRERRQTNRDVFGAFGARRGVTHPLVARDDNSLSGGHVVRSRICFHAKTTAQHHREFIKLRFLRRFAPAGRTNHARDTQHARLRIHPADEFFDGLRRISVRLDAHR